LTASEELSDPGKTFQEELNGAKKMFRDAFLAPGRCFGMNSMMLRRRCEMNIRTLQ
jgi:hypothetical protein